jgi:hypothetical protein
MKKVLITLGVSLLAAIIGLVVLILYTVTMVRC